MKTDFDSPEFRERFEKETHERLLRASGPLLLAGGAFLLVMSVSDVYYLPHSPAAGFAGRIAVAVFAAVAWFLVRRTGRRTGLALMTAVFAAASVLLSTLYVLSGATTAHYDAGLVACMFLPALFLPMRPVVVGALSYGSTAYFLVLSALLGPGITESWVYSVFPPGILFSAAAFLSTIASVLAWRRRSIALRLHMRLEKVNEELRVRVDQQQRALELEQHVRERDQRLAAIGELSSTIVHDLRNPLVSVLGFGDMALEAMRAGNASEAERGLVDLDREARRLARIVQEILDFARDEPPRIQTRPEVVSEFLAGVIAPMRQLMARYGIDLVFESGLRGVVVADLDPDRMHRVLENLVDNARKALARVDGKCRPRTIRISAAADEATVTVRVVDNGSGVAGSIRDDLFEPHCHGADSAGLGLGLPNARRVVEMHGGSIELEDDPPGGGAAFRIRLPRMRLNAPAPDPPSAASLAETTPSS